MIDHRRESRRLSRTVGTDHQNHAPAQHDEFLDLLRHPQIVELGELRCDKAQNHGDIAALMEHVDAKPAEADLRDGKVDLQFPSKLFELALVHEFECSLPNHFRRQLHLIDRQDLAVDLDHHRRECGEEEVRSLLIHHQLEEWFDVHVSAVGAPRLAN